MKKLLMLLGVLFITACDPPDDKFELHLPRCIHKHSDGQEHTGSWHLQGLVADTSSDTIVAQVICR